MAEDKGKNGQLVKAKTSSLQKIPSNIVSRGLSDLALLDFEDAEIVDDQANEIRPGDNVYLITPNEWTDEQTTEYFKTRSKAITFCRKGQYDMAIEDHNKAITLNPNFAQAYNSRGLAYAKKGQCDRAVEDYNKAIALDPNNDTGCYYNNRGSAYEMKGNIDKAISDFQKACDMGFEMGCENLRRVLRQK